MQIFSSSQVKTLFLVVFLCLIIFLTLWSGILSDEDALDKKAMRKLFSIPKEYTMEEYRRYTGGGGAMQRENLGLSARYKLSLDQSKNIETRIQNEGWESLPIKDSDILEHFLGRSLGQDLLNDFTDKNGYFRCRTNGDDVLYGFNVKPCTEDNKGYVFTNCPVPGKTEGCTRNRQLSDIILEVYIPESKTLIDIVHANY
jgi:hypothetical protein